MSGNSAPLAVLLLMALRVPLPATAQGTDIARGKSVTASTNETATMSADKAFDGKNATRWSSLYTDPQWIRIDLGASYAVARVVLSWEKASAKDYRVEISRDDSTWKTIARRSNMATGARTDDIALSGTGRYVRVYCTARTSKFGYSLTEVAVYGAPPTAAVSGLFLDVGCGMSMPVGSLAAQYNWGVAPSLGFGWRSTLGPGRVRIGLETGMLWQDTKSDPLTYAQYDSFIIPLGAYAAYDLTIAGGFHAYVGAGGGYSATLVYYALDELTDMGILKPYAGGCAGLGFDTGKGFSIRGGARFLSVFYDGNAFMSVAPELSIELRF